MLRIITVKSVFLPILSLWPLTKCFFRDHQRFAIKSHQFSQVNIQYRWYTIPDGYSFRVHKRIPIISAAFILSSIHLAAEMPPCHAIPLPEKRKHPREFDGWFPIRFRPQQRALPSTAEQIKYKNKILSRCVV